MSATRRDPPRDGEPPIQSGRRLRPQQVCSIPIGQATAHHLIQVIRPAGTPEGEATRQQYAGRRGRSERTRASDASRPLWLRTEPHQRRRAGRWPDIPLVSPREPPPLNSTSRPPLNTPGRTKAGLSMRREPCLCPGVGTCRQRHSRGPLLPITAAFGPSGERGSHRHWTNITQQSPGLIAVAFPTDFVTERGRQLAPTRVLSPRHLRRYGGVIFSAVRSSGRR